jgi:hypothetical protein
LSTKAAKKGEELHVYGRQIQYKEKLEGNGVNTVYSRESKMKAKKVHKCWHVSAEGAGVWKSRFRKGRVGVQYGLRNGTKLRSMLENW